MGRNSSSDCSENEDGNVIKEMPKQTTIIEKKGFTRYWCEKYNEDEFDILLQKELDCRPGIKNEYNDKLSKKIIKVYNPRIREYSEIFVSTERCDIVYIRSHYDIDKWKNELYSYTAQTFYMSGDRYVIALATALQIEKWGILIIAGHSANSREQAEDLANFYSVILKKSNKHLENRIAIFITDDTGAYKMYKDEYSQYFFTEEKLLLANQHDDTSAQREYRKFIIPGGATRIVADLFKKHNESSSSIDYPTILAQQFLDESISETGARNIPEANEIEAYLQKHSLPGDRKYAFIWSKAWGGAHTYHSSDPEGLKQMIKVAQEAGRYPVLVGDKPTNWIEGDHKGVTELWDFWNAADFPKRLKEQGRLGQLKFDRYLCCHRDVTYIGMRSGRLEVAAYFGMKTIYMEEESSNQASRLETLFEYMPNLHRIILDKPAGKEQKRALAEFLETHRDRNTKLDSIQSRIHIKKAILSIKRNLYEKLSYDEKESLYSLLKDDYIGYLNKIIDALKRDTTTGFADNDLDVMRKMLKLSQEDIKRGISYIEESNENYWKIDPKNHGYARMFCKANEHIIDSLIKEIIRKRDHPKTSYRSLSTSQRDDYGSRDDKHDQERRDYQDHPSERRRDDYGSRGDKHEQKRRDYQDHQSKRRRDDYGSRDDKHDQERRDYQDHQSKRRRDDYRSRGDKHEQERRDFKHPSERRRDDYRSIGDKHEQKRRDFKHPSERRRDDYRSERDPK